MKTRVNKLLSTLLVMAIMLGLFAAVPLTARAAAGDYNTGDIAIINAMIDNNNLTFSKAPTNGSSVPTYWDAYIVWSSVATNKRIIQLNLGGRYDKLTGALNLSGLTSLQRASLYSHNITSLNVSGLTNLTYLDCEGNNLSTLNVSSLTNLETLDCQNNSLTSLNVSALTKLKTLYAQKNSLTSLVLNSSAPYTYIDVRDNKMASTAAVTGKTIAWDTGSFYFSPQNIISAPTNLTATVGATGITLTWKDNSNNEDGFMVERREGSGSWSTLTYMVGSGTVGANVTTYTDTSAVTGKTYNYRVRAYTGTLLSRTFSAYSNEVTVTMPAITTYAVTIISGTGGGNFAAGATVNINANTAPSGKIFDTWTASGVTLSSPGSANTTFIMPSNAVTVTATYKDLPAPTYTITIQNEGNGTANANSSSASTGTAITLSATPSSGYQFKEWQVVSGGVTIASNSFTMPASNVTIKAVFEQIPATTTPPSSSTTTSNNSTPPIAVIVLLAIILIGATVFITILVMKKKKS